MSPITVFSLWSSLQIVAQRERIKRDESTMPKKITRSAARGCLVLRRSFSVKRGKNILLRPFENICLEDSLLSIPSNNCLLCLIFKQGWMCSPSKFFSLCMSIVRDMLLGLCQIRVLLEDPFKATHIKA